MKKIKIIFFISGMLFLASCGGDSKHNTTDSTTVLEDTVPAAQMPPGAVNAGEDSSRFGTGVNDTSKNRLPQ
jgi:uncharacterized protein YcfL